MLRFWYTVVLIAFARVLVSVQAMETHVKPWEEANRRGGHTF